ncbi:septal ring lytic transglycosylase RlpA family protein [Desulfosediminicola ganghwensis]|uniref:septal ring lytic transglycosylase RlpA family protein n=1 Tax=Desulfosediminicola ganghwensis TaxID=2569540 RepID=UPI0010ABD70C|nr:septal ring lytic transglycosylase RlpA family protein [Desulfosediminicola ganghwensis]
MPHTLTFRQTTLRVVRKPLANRFSYSAIVFLTVLLLLGGCSKSNYPVSSPGANTNSGNEPTQRPYTIKNITYYPIPHAHGFTERGVASWYGKKFHGRTTSNGERYDMYAMTAAHKTLPMGTMLLVKNLENGKETIVRVNDRGPFVRGRIIDLSYTAANKLDIVQHGLAKVQIVALADTTQLAASASGKKPLPDLYHGEFYVQIGSFSRRDNALRLMKRFTDAGHSALIKTHQGLDRIYYRVHVYAGNELSIAKRAEAALIQHGYNGAFLVAR